MAYTNNKFFFSGLISSLVFGVSIRARNFRYLLLTLEEGFLLNPVLCRFISTDVGFENTVKFFLTRFATAFNTHIYTCICIDTLIYIVLFIMYF